MIFEQLTEQLQSLASLLKTLRNEQYTKQIKHLGDASIGGHTRHIIELLQCALDGYHLNKVDYVHRIRNLALENDKHFALEKLNWLMETILLEDKELQMVVETNHSNTIVLTSFYREIIYNTEHTIHHLALIKVALLEMDLHVVEQDFGMAYSTIQYKASLAKA